MLILKSHHSGGKETLRCWFNWKQQQTKREEISLNPSGSASLLPHFLVKPTDEGLRCTSISTAFPSLWPIHVWSRQAERICYLPKEKLWLCGRRHLQMWACCLSWEFQEFQVINLCDLHPCQACEKAPKFSPGLISKLNSIHTSTGAFLPALRGYWTFPSLSFLRLEQQNSSLLSLRKKQTTFFSYLTFGLAVCRLDDFIKDVEERLLMREMMSQLCYSVRRMNIIEYVKLFSKITEKSGIQCIQITD